MSPISWVDIIGMIVLPVVGFMILWMLSIQKDLNEHKLNVASNYVKQEGLAAALDKIEATLERIFSKLDALAARRTTDHRENEI